MQAITLDLNKSIYGNGKSILEADIELSLKPFIVFLKDRADREKTGKINFYNYLLEQFSAYPELLFSIHQEDTAKYNHLFELIYTALSPIINDEHEQLWAVGKPVSACFYYGTNAFYNVLLDHKKESLKPDLSLPSKTDMDKNMLRNFYNLILQKFYNFTLGGKQYTIKSVTDQKTHLTKYYRLNVDNRFMDVQCEGELPELTLQHAKDYMNDENNSLEILTKLLPSKLFSIQGISIVILTDVTGEYALEGIKNTIIEHNQCMEGWNSSTISGALKSLVGTDAIDFGLLPYIRLNKKTLLYSHPGFQSVIIQQAKESGMPETEYTALVDSFVDHPRSLIFSDIEMEASAEYPMLKLIKDKGIHSYALFPLYFNAKLVGCLELYTHDPAEFNGATLSKIETAFPLLAQLYQNIITDFNNEIINIVTDKFTGLQSSVQWRFYQAAYDYMKSGDWEKNLPIERVYFEDVHPFYGAIDIRNSSIERNLMIRKDLFTHFEILKTTLKNLSEKFPGRLDKDFPKRYIDWSSLDFDELSDKEIMKADDYLQRQLPPYFRLLKDIEPDAAPFLDEYFELTQSGGKVFENRDHYELSMQMINHAVNRSLDAFNTELQEIYPCYFEKFRSDGVEFDIYLGQSITPDIKFSDDLLSDFRFRQLKVITEIAQDTANLTSHLPIPLETTQLIFVYANLIDISFRIDEQRFDVEGGYNIRYQMVKKRIDKAHIKDSTERLTQPGKIAIVYFNSKEAQEYMGYIHQLQAAGLLTKLIEYIEVEELQGVEGLKALRVEVAVKTV
ncbi:GAF domain-containing protein [Pedobacter sp. L105]|uniref:GAF domain-containing protein n=1 Tax=Pedobacter sp. L105 TaxID=1641871 RepID=UPI00131A6C85|nr:GAF domain-containing protein [Pedobacter sp. L105]